MLFERQFRHTKRYQEIVNTFIRYGFGYVLYRIGITDRDLSKKDESTDANVNLQNIGRRLRYTLQDLGPTFIKLGQVASTRHDVLPREIITELEKLQDHVTVLPFDHVRQTIESELDDELEHLFVHVEPEPLATASIGQVHAAKLFTGEDVVIKVQRPGLKPIVETDMEILVRIGNLLEERTEWAKRYRIQAIIQELSFSLRNELDYLIEGHSGERIANQFQNKIGVRVPAIYWDFTTQKVLTMEPISGIKISDIETLDAEGYDRKLLAKRLSDAMLTQILDEGFFHADPHSGNVYILPKNTIAFLDFGEVGRLSEGMTYHISSIIYNLHNGDTQALIRTFAKMDLIDEKTDINAFQRDLGALHERYANLMLKDMSLGKVIIEIFQVAYHHAIDIPSEMAMVSKTILTLEGVIGRLDPEFSIMKAAEPYARKLLKRRYSPRRILRKSMNEIVENVEILSGLPKDLKDVMSTLQRGRVGLDINVKQAERFLDRFDKISNRLSFSIIMLAFSILMAGLIIGSAITDQSTVIWKLPIIEIGAVIATLMFILMVITIIRSGRM
ncbi:ABC1 kinase family protein [Lentibacillus cibarius]|uniref:ABC1 kinase family protein n=1 Tax=Lentibacillus cibarius TaxID=2583219 RepID=UPI001F450131|nr:AarF/UbiB family protein [Lentibacillus cibarius]